MKIPMIKKLGIVSCLAVACAIMPPASPVHAQAGLTFEWGGREKTLFLDYCNDDKSRGRSSRYYLEIPAQKFKFTEILVVYKEDNAFNERGGVFDESDVKVRKTNDCRGGQDLEIESVKWDKEARRLTIIPKEAVPSKTPLRVVLSNVRNPEFSGFYSFIGRVSRSDIPLPEYIGTWLVDISD